MNVIKGCSTSRELENGNSCGLVDGEGAAPAVAEQFRYVADLEEVINHYLEPFEAVENQNSLPEALCGKPDCLLGNIRKLCEFHDRVVLEDLVAARSTLKMCRVHAASQSTPDIRRNERDWKRKKSNLDWVQSLGSLLKNWRVEGAEYSRIQTESEVDQTHNSLDKPPSFGDCCRRAFTNEAQISNECVFTMFLESLNWDNFPKNDTRKEQYEEKGGRFDFLKFATLTAQQQLSPPLTSAKEVDDQETEFRPKLEEKKKVDDFMGLPDAADEHRHASRYDPYPARVPVRGPRDGEHSTAHTSRPVVHMWNRQSSERYEIVLARREVAVQRKSYAELLDAAKQSLQSRHEAMPDVEHNPIAPRVPPTRRFAGRLSFAPPQHNAGLIATENASAPRFLPNASGNLPLPNQLPDVEVRRVHPRIQAPERDQEDQEADPFEHWAERFAYAKTIHGMVCMVEKDQIKLFNFKRRYMHIIPNNLEVSPKLYQYIRMTEGSFVTIGKEYTRDIIEYISNTGQILTWATSPNAEEIAQMSKETREMFQGKIWSPRLGYLADPDRNFNPEFIGKEVWICAKYAPTEDAHFQIVKTYSEREGEERFVDTPWMRMILGMYFDEADHDFVIPSGSSRRLRHGGVVEHAVCIATDVRNLQYKKRRMGDLKKDGGSKERCNIFFNRLFGIYRCLKPAELGRWYSHNSSDVRASKKKNKGHLSLYRAVTVGRMRPVDAPLPTQVREGRVQMTIEFEIKSLEQLSFIWDKYVGKVMIDIIFWTFITNMVKHHHKNEVHNGKGAFYKELVKKGITIRALALTRDNYETANEYPTNGAFILGTVFLIKYKETNEIIFQKVE